MPSSTLSAAVVSSVLVAALLPLPPVHGGLHPVRSSRILITRQTLNPTNPLTPTREPIAQQSLSTAGIDPGSQAQYHPPIVHYQMWAAWGLPASGAIPSCSYCTRQLKGFVGCAARQSYPDGVPPAVNWTAPPQCLSRYAGLQQCQFGEVGYAIMQTSNPKTSANLVYGTAVGGCKDSVNFYAIVGHGGPWALTAKACTSLNTKILTCILATNNDMNAFHNTYTGCSVYTSRGQSALATACWTNPGTYTVYYDGYNNTAWLAAYPTSTGLAEYAIFDSSQAFYKGGQAWQVHGKKTIVAGNMGSLQPWMGS